MNMNNTNAAPLDENIDQAMISRRRFLAGLSIASGAFAAAVAGIPVVGFILSPFVQKTPEVWRAVGTVDSFEVGKTVPVSFPDASPLPWAGVTAQTAAWLRRVSEQEFIAFSINCTHLGCPVRWLPDADLFMCPCHGGVYYEDGVVAAGPPPKPLPRYPVRVQNGQVEIRTSPIPITT
jgi:menaquinol-cytochrome c reductase iron-sulfur subunit